MLKGFFDNSESQLPSREEMKFIARLLGVRPPGKREKPEKCLLRLIRAIKPLINKLRAALHANTFEPHYHPELILFYFKYKPLWWRLQREDLDKVEAQA